MSRSVKVSFISKTPIENIEAINSQVSSLFDSSTGEIVFQVPIKGFHFEKALMEEHFNENYMESEKFPNATLQGVVVDWESFNESETGDVSVSGELTMHGVTVSRTFEGNIRIEDDNYVIQAEFEVKTEDHQIQIPNLVRSQIAESINVSVEGVLTPR